MKKRLMGIDLLRGLAAFGIVGCHLELPVCSGVAKFLLSYCDMNVSVFAAVSGFVMYDGLFQKTAGEYIVGRLRRLLPVYLFWSLVYVVFSMTFKIIAHASLDRYADADFWCGVFFQGGAACHLWFLICLLYMQMAMRLLLRRTTALWLLACCAVALVVTASAFGGNWYGRYLARLMGFVLLGYCLRPFSEMCASLNPWFWVVLTVAALGAHWFLTGWVPAFVRDGLVVVPVVVLAGRLTIENAGVVRVIEFLSVTSLGVYLAHPIFAKFGGLVLSKISDAPFGLWPVLSDWIGVWAAALLTTAVLCRVPWTKRIVQ